MQIPSIKCFTSTIANKMPDNYFFILAKGNNAGKPLKEPCPNCFIVECADYDQREYFYWLSYALWQGKHYSIHLRGSVIPYLVKRDVEKSLERGMLAATERSEHYRKAVVRMRIFAEHKRSAEELLRKQLQVHRQLLHTILFYQNPSFKNH